MVPLGAFSRAVLDVLWPPACPACGGPAWEPDGLCGACASELPGARRRCPRCGRAAPPAGAVAPCAWCQGEDLRLDGVVAGFSYGGVARDLVLGLKFRGRLEAVRPLAQRLADAVRARRIPGDLLVPVPLGARRRRERGYDQAALLAEHLGRRLDVALEPAGLVRRRHTPPQALLGRRRRLRSPKGAFAAHRPRVADRAVLLVDDVLTTGGTARACAVALRRAGARAVVAAVACRAEVAAAPDGRRRAGAKVSGGGGPSP